MITLDLGDTDRCPRCGTSPTSCSRCKQPRCDSHIVASATLDQRVTNEVVTKYERVRGQLIGVNRQPVCGNPAHPHHGMIETPVFEWNEVPYEDTVTTRTWIFRCEMANGEMIEVVAPDGEIERAGWLTGENRCVDCRHDAMFEALALEAHRKAEEEVRKRQAEAERRKRFQDEVAAAKQRHQNAIVEFDRDNHSAHSGLPEKCPPPFGPINLIWLGPLVYTVSVMGSGYAYSAIEGIDPNDVPESVEATVFWAGAGFVAVAYLIAVLWRQWNIRRWRIRDAIRQKRTQLTSGHANEIKLIESKYGLVDG